MKITIIYGSQRKSSTYNCVQIFKKELDNKENNEYKEFFLPKDLPNFCLGCFTCFYKGEQNCPHNESVGPIVDAIDWADAIILSSPAYCLSVSGQMKAFIDHLGYRWMPHRPDPKMFNKIGLALSTTAGLGAYSAVQLMKKSFDFWGMKRIFTAPFAVGAKSWDEVKPDVKVKIEKNLKKKANKFWRTYKNINKTGSRLKTRFLFSLMRGMHKKK